MHSVIFTFFQAPAVQVALNHAFCHFYLISRAYCPSSIEPYIWSFLSHFRCLYSAQVALNHAFCHFYLISGAYCPNGTEYAYQFPCPAGTYNNLTLANDMYDCLPCPGRSALAVALFGSQTTLVPHMKDDSCERQMDPSLKTAFCETPSFFTIQMYSSA